VCNHPGYKRKRENDKNKSAYEIKIGIPYKVMWYLPIIPRLKCLFAHPREAKLMHWHEDGPNKDEMLRRPTDVVQWRNMDRKYYNTFSNEPRNLKFGLSMDGMNPFGNMSSKQSTWPVILYMYNLPPWLYMKKKYRMMSMVIQGPKQPDNDIDIYLKLLVDELQTLWKHGVKVHDAYRK
jgi:hypothetical protein